jgi:hypothetical protein
MIFSYRGAVTLMKVLLLPTPGPTPAGLGKEWVRSAEIIAKKSTTPLHQKSHLRALINEYNRRRKMPKKMRLYPAGSRSSKGILASKGRRAKMMPFGTWYFKSV